MADVQWCEKLDASVAFYTPGSSPYAVGGSLSLVDFAIYSWIDGLKTNPSVMALEGAKPWETLTRICAIHKNIDEMAAVQKWCAERPVTPF